MDTKKFLFGTVAGGVVAYIIGFLIFGLALKNFFDANMSSGFAKDPPDMLWMIIGHLLLGAFVTYVFMQWASISTLAGGIKAGLVIGLFVAFTYSIILYGASTMYNNLTAAIADAICTGIVIAAGGAGAGWALGTGKK